MTMYDLEKNIFNFAFITLPEQLLIDQIENYF